MEYIIIFGSAITRNYKLGHILPSDIDIISNMSEDKIQQKVNEWSLENFGNILPLDIHEPIYNGKKVEVPVLKKEELLTGYKLLWGNPEVYTFIRDNGFASVLRVYGSNPEVLLERLKKGEILSLLPKGSYYQSCDDMDKYYSGLQAYRNAAKHANLEEIFPHLNCGKLLKRLLTEDPTHWKASSDITDDPLPYGIGWSMAVNINISSDVTAPVCISSTGENLTADDVEEIIF